MSATGNKNVFGEAHETHTNGFDLDELWPAVPGGSWPPGFTVGRDQIYDGCGRLTGGPGDEADGGSGSR